MNIVFVTYHTCARAHKMSRALNLAGHEVIVLQHLAVSVDMLYEQEMVSFYRNDYDLAEKVKAFDPWADVFHCHNEPNWPVVVTAKNATKPVVYDCHDLESQRHGIATKNEIEAFRLVDAAIFPSLAYAYGATNYHNLDEYGPPIEIVFSMCLKEDRALIKGPPIHAIAYEGHHIAPAPGTDFKPGHPLYYGYRDYLPFVTNCAAIGVPTSFIGTKKEFASAYRQMGAMVTPMIPFHEMINELTRYSWGFCGHPDDHPQWQKAMPNKLFEYLAAGLPIIAWNCAEVEMWIQGYDVGTVVNSYQELEYIFNNTKLRDKYADKIRTLLDEGHINMEIQVPKIIGVYEKAIKGKEDQDHEGELSKNRV
jgi:glycosyltransferase involved in cell wall biosynthesis